MFKKMVLCLFFIGLFIVVCCQKQKIINKKDSFVMRTGVNVSHWLSQSTKRGEERKNYITEADFDTITSMGFDHVRIPVDEEQLWDTDGNKEKEAFNLLHNAIRWAFTSDLRVIVDLHIIRSHDFIAESNPLWTDPVEQQKLVELWQQLSGELSQYPNDKLAYEILNEAVADDPEDWNKLVQKVISDIRKREPLRPIVMGSNRWQIADTFPDLRIPEDDANIILSFHFYTPLAVTHHRAPWTQFSEYTGPVNYPGQAIDPAKYDELSESALAFMDIANGYFTKDSLEKVMSPAIQVAKDNNLPLYCGEFGIYPTIPENIMHRWYRDVCEIFNKHHIAYCHWCYKGDFPVVGKNSKPNQKLVSILTAE